MVIDHKKIILSQTGRGISLRKLVGFVNVAFFWGVMFYLTRSLFLTVLGAVDALFGWGAVPGLIDPNVARLFLAYAGLVVAASSSLWLWAHYNRHRFSGAKDKRRVHPPALTLVEISDYTGFSIAKLQQMRHAKVLVAHFDDARELVEMDCYTSVREKENLTASGQPAFKPRELKFAMQQEIEDIAVELVV